MRLLLALSALAALAFSQDCTSQLAAKKSCMRELHAAKRERFESELKPQLDACFTDNDCRQPSPIVEAMMTCKGRVVREMLVPAIQSCPGLEGVEAEDIVGKLTRMGKGKGKAKMAFMLAAALCPERAQAQAALECVRDVLPGHGHGSSSSEEDDGPGSSEEDDGPGSSEEGGDDDDDDEQSGPSEAHWNMHRQKLQCKLAIQDYSCFQQKRAMKAAACECSQNLGVDEAAVNDAFKACMPEELQTAVASRFGADFQPLDMIKKKMCRKGHGKGRRHGGGRRFRGGRRFGGGGRGFGGRGFRG